MNTRAFGSGRPVSLFTLGTMRALNSAAQMAAVSYTHLTLPTMRTV